MLSYQHIYHAGNLADVHKHALLAWMLAYLTQKDKPLSYLETHAGRGLYQLDASEAVKTGEAAAGIGKLAESFPKNHPYRRRLDEVRTRYGDKAYPGSPLIAALSLRAQDSLHMAELHPQEHEALLEAMYEFPAYPHKQDGFEMAQSLCPPTPRRGLLLIDPSYELKEDYDRLPRIIETLNRKWNVGVIALWYPILGSGIHTQMLAELSAMHPEALRHEVKFGPARKGHRMIGSGMFILNPPYGLGDEAKRLSNIFRTRA